MPWVYDPHSGGTKIRPHEQILVRDRILKHAEKHYARRYERLDIRFHGQFCYIDAFIEPDVPEGWPPKDWGETRAQYIERLRKTPCHLCRLRHFTEDRWSLAFYSYASSSYVPSVFHSGEFVGTPEEGFDVGATHLPEPTDTPRRGARAKSGGRKPKA
jgi:hypothetical protein